MMSGLYTGTMGMQGHENAMAVVSNNISNVNTVAYKQDNWLFQDMMYDGLSLGNSNAITSNQVGNGAIVFQTKTLFTQGGYEATNNFMDLSISGKGFFQVADPSSGQEYLTRAGNFIFDADGYYVDPSGMQVQAYAINPTTGEKSNTLGPVQIPTGSSNSLVAPSTPTSMLQAQFNLNLTTSNVNTYTDVIDPETGLPVVDVNGHPTGEKEISDPFFSLLNTYDANNTPAIDNTGYSQAMTVYDTAGNARELTLHFDLATSSNGKKVMEFIATIPADEDGRAGVTDEKAGLLMSGTMTFESNGQLSSISAFTPNVGTDLNDLSNWTPAELDADGYPLMNVDFAPKVNVADPDATVDPVAQQIALNLGAKATNGWTNNVTSAADVGTSYASLPGIGVPPELSSTASTAYAGSSSTTSFSQDGVAEGHLSSLFVTSDGTITGSFSNGQNLELYSIPLVNVTSEDGLRREGSNLYLVTDAAGEVFTGTAGTENFGSVLSSGLEVSNVDLAVEMVNLIVLQRGFQSNSKVITTIDTMLQKATELKKN